MALRRIEPISLRGLMPRNPGELPELIWVRPDDLYVDETYQRTLSAGSTRTIRRIINEFDWARFKPLNVAETDEGYKILNGQHGAIAVVSHPDVELVPVLVTRSMSLSEQAGAFVSHARDVLEVTRTQTHHSAVVARDPLALALDAVLKRNGVVVRRNPPPEGRYEPGETMAVQTLYKLLRRRGSNDLSTLLDLLKTRAPITAIELMALDLMMHDPDLRDDWDVEAIRPIVTASTDYEKREAEDIATVHQRPVYRALALVWYRRVPRRAKVRVSGLTRVHP